MQKEEDTDLLVAPPSLSMQRIEPIGSPLTHSSEFWECMNIFRQIFGCAFITVSGSPFLIVDVLTCPGVFFGYKG